MFEIFGIEFAGKHSYRDFKITLQSAPKISGPKPEILKEEIPYMNGSYDFTNLNEATAFGEREVTFSFNIIGSDFNDLLCKTSAVKEWLYNGKSGDLKYDAIHDLYYHQARCTSIEISDINKRHTTATLTVTFATAPYMSNKGADINLLTTENIQGVKEYMLYRVSEAVECAYITNGDIVSAPPVYAITVSGYSGNISVSVSSNQKIHFRIQGTDKLAHVQISYTGSGGSTSTIITADYINTSSNTYDFYIRNRNGTLNFNFTFKQSLTAAADGIASIIGRKVNTVAISGFNDPLLPITVKTEGNNGCTVQCNDNYSQTFQPLTTAKAAFEIGYGYNRINFAGGGAVTATLKYLTLIEVL